VTPQRRTRILAKRLLLRRLAGWVRQDGEGSPESFALDTSAKRLPVRIPGASFRERQRLSLVAAYRGKGRRGMWALWIDPGSGHHGWVVRPFALARRLGLPWRPATWLDLPVAGFLVWAVAVRALRFPAVYQSAEALVGEDFVGAVLGRVFGLFHGVDRLLVEMGWMRAYDRVFDFPGWLGVGVVLAYAAVRLLLAGLSLGYAAFRLRRSVLRIAGVAR